MTRINSKQKYIKISSLSSWLLTAKANTFLISLKQSILSFILKISGSSRKQSLGVDSPVVFLDHFCKKCFGEHFYFNIDTFYLQSKIFNIDNIAGRNLWKFGKILVELVSWISFFEKLVWVRGIVFLRDTFQLLPQKLILVFSCTNKKLLVGRQCSLVVSALGYHY